MPDPLPKLRLGTPTSTDPAPMFRHIDEAFQAYAARQPQKAAAALHAAESAAKAANLLTQAAKIRKALTILAQGGKPRLLTRHGYLTKVAER